MKEKYSIWAVVCLVLSLLYILPTFLPIFLVPPSSLFFYSSCSPPCQDSSSYSEHFTIIGWIQFLSSIILPIFSLISGIVALIEIKKKNKTGKSLAIIGLIIVIISLIYLAWAYSAIERSFRW